MVHLHNLLVMIGLSEGPSDLKSVIGFTVEIGYNEVNGNRQSLRYICFFVISALYKSNTQKRDSTAITGTCLECLQKMVEASLHAVFARSELR